MNRQISFNKIMTDRNDTLTIDKGQSDWVILECETNDRPNGKITLRSINAVRDLHFWLGRLLIEIDDK